GKEGGDGLAAGGWGGPWDRDLCLTRHGARQQQVRNIGAGDEQHESDQPLQDDQRALEPGPKKGLAARRGNQGGAASQETVLQFGKLHEEVGFDLLFLALAIEHLDGGLRLRDADTGLETAEEIEPRVPLVFEIVAGRGENGFHRNGSPDVGGESDIGAFEAGGGNADHGEGEAVEANGGADDAWLAAETVLPEIILENGNGIAVL